MSVPALRASEDDRERVIRELREHFAAGRLTSDEFSERVSAVYDAATLGELAEATRDLPALTEARKEALEREIRKWVVHGWRVESRSEHSAVLVAGTNPNHALHALLTLFTGLWAIVWLAVALTGGEDRVLLEVDELGNVNAEEAPAR